MKFTDSHEWIKVEEGIGVVGITGHAKRELGEVVYIELPSVGKQIKSGEEVVVLESTKAAADIYSPVSGEIIEINQDLGHSPDKLNECPETEGWLYKIKLSEQSELEKLLDKQQYKALVS